MQEFSASGVMEDDRGYLTHEQVEAILNACDNLRDYVFIKFLYRTGRRISEVVGTWGIMPADINFEDSQITFHILKKNPRRKKILKDGTVILPNEQAKKEPYTRTLPVEPGLLDDIQRYIRSYDIRPLDKLFPFSRVWAFKLVNAIALRAAKLRPELFKVAFLNNKERVLVGRKGIHNHTFRHSFAVNMAKFSGGTLEESRLLQILMQHSSIVQTQAYMQYSPNEIKRLLAKASKPLPAFKEEKSSA